MAFGVTAPLRTSVNGQDRTNQDRNQDQDRVLFITEYSQAYVMEKLLPILTMSTCGTSLGMSWWCDRANRKTSYSCDSVGKSPPVEQHRGDISEEPGHRTTEEKTEGKEEGDGEVEVEVEEQPPAHLY